MCVPVLERVAVMIGMLMLTTHEGVACRHLMCW